MNGRSRLLVGLAIVALGAGTLWVAATQAEADVRYVEDVLADPAAHRDGSFTLMGIPQPERVPLAGVDGPAPNPHYRNETRDTTTWVRDGVTLFSTRILSVEVDDQGRLVWTLRNETRRAPADPEPVEAPQVVTWTHGRAGEAFPVEAFSPDGKPRAGLPRVWAWYAKPPENPMQPKPSQFTGHLMSELPDGTPLPDGALVYEVREYTAGCSSKFLPPEARETYESYEADTPAVAAARD